MKRSIRKYKFLTKALLQNEYIDKKKSLNQLTQELNVPRTTLTRRLKRFGFKIRWHKGIPHTDKHKENLSKALKGRKVPWQIGSKNSGWKGGKFYNQEGYKLIRMPNHPRAYKNGYVPEHRIIVEKKIGRYLKEFEHVHHLNGIKDDNRLDNLELINAQTHNLVTRLESEVKKLRKENKELKQKLNLI